MNELREMNNTFTCLVISIKKKKTPIPMRSSLEIKKTKPPAPIPVHAEHLRVFFN